MSDKNLNWNPFLEGYFENPHRHLRFWREHNPVQKGVSGGWMLFKYQDVKAFAADPLFKTWKTQEAIASITQNSNGTQDFSDLAEIFDKILLFMDPPEQTQLRSVIGKVWNARQWQESVGEAIDESIAVLSRKKQADLVIDFARPVPTRLISKILGLPGEDYALITNWSYQFIAALEPFVSLYQLEKYNRQAREFYRYMSEVIELKELEPDNLFISRLLETNKTLSAPLSRSDIISILCMLFFAGIETSVNLLSQSILLLVQNPRQAAIARETEQLSPTAVNELVRYVSPVNYTKRVASTDVEIRGSKIKAGEALMGSFISANFDEEVFENPERLDLTRAHNPHLGFGHGAHFCLGAKLGREQISRSIPALFRTFPNIKLQIENPRRWDKLIMNRALKSLPVNLS
jgi:pimeloyl-[acyl-carrier protein] synthase